MIPEAFPPLTSLHPYDTIDYHIVQAISGSPCLRKERMYFFMAMKFGLFLPQGSTKELAGMKDPVEAYEILTDVARAAEDAGFHSLWLSDVFWPSDASGASQASQDFLFECWMTTAAVARDTRHIRIGQMVTCNVFRHPSLLAKMASTVDVLSHGRFTLGIGSGSPLLASQFRAYYGEEYPESVVRLAQLREAVQILLAMWTQDEAHFEGKYYQVRGAINQPKGVQRPHLPLLIAGGGEQVTLKLVARYGDACNVVGDPATVEHKLAVLREHCDVVGRNYQQIQRTSGMTCVPGETDELAWAKVPTAARAYLAKTGLIGSPTTIRARVARYEDAGVQELVLRFPDLGPREASLDTVRRFAQEVIG
jgi:F420-dependent oxidoreductase-like protein